MESHSLKYSIFLHLFPGILITLFFIFSAPFLSNAGIPVIAGILMAIAVVLVPFELGAILAASKKEYGSYSLKATLAYTRPIRWPVFLLLAVALFLWSGIALVFAAFLDEPIIQLFFSWLPDWFFLNEDLSGYPKSTLIVTITAMFFLNGLIGPIVEELYFRGYLLPRIAYLKNGAPVWNAVLFSFYHFFTPWQNIGRIIGLIPMCFVVFRKKNIYIGMAVHCLGNIFATLSLLAYL